MLRFLFDNARNPTNGVTGRFVLNLMNLGHQRLSVWGLSHLDTGDTGRILDVGCGGGRNLRNLRRLAPAATVIGVDRSEASVATSRRFNRSDLVTGRIEVQVADVAALPFADGSFDAVTAFETVYFWPDLTQAFAEVARVLRPGGHFLVCNEMGRPEDAERWSRFIAMDVPTGVRLESFLDGAGFSGAERHGHPNGRWLCVIGRR